MEKRFELFTTAIAKISRNIRKIKSEEVASINLDLKGPHVSCLYYLYKHKKLTLKELSLVCDEDKAAISRSIDYLEHNLYIEFENKQEKHYKSTLKLTKKGEIIAKQINEKINEMVNLASNGLSEEKRKNFYESLILISNNLQKLTDKYGA